MRIQNLPWQVSYCAESINREIFLNIGHCDQVHYAVGAASFAGATQVEYSMGAGFRSSQRSRFASMYGGNDWEQHAKKK